MRLALPSFPSHSGSRLTGRMVPVRRRRSRRRRALALGTRAVKTAVPVKLGGRVARGTRATIALPVLGLGALVVFVRSRLRARREITFDAAVGAPAPMSQTPTPAAADASPENPETDLPAAPNGSSKSDEDRETAKAAVSDVDAPKEGAPGHEPA
jgi:hypothetical protein